METKGTTSTKNSGRTGGTAAPTNNNNPRTGIATGPATGPAATPATGGNPVTNPTGGNPADLMSLLQAVARGASIEQLGAAAAGNLPGGGLGPAPLSAEELDQTETDADFDDISLEDMSKMLGDDNMAQIFLDSITLFKYSGFSPDEVFNALKKYASIAKISRGQFVQDVVDLISYYLSRGTTVQKRGVTNSQSQAASTRITILMQRYRIQDNVGPNAKGTNVITLGRIMNTFPEIVGMKLSAGHAKPIGQRGLVPRALSFAGGAALIPSGKEYDYLFDHFVTYAVSFDRTVNRLQRNAKKQAFDEEDSRENATYWASLARENSRHSDEFRLTFLRTYVDDFDLGITFDPKTGEATAVDAGKYKRRA